MTTISPRLNITLPEETRRLLELKARHEKKSLSRIALDLLEEAIHQDEDIYWLKIAQERDTPAAQFVSHENAWK